MAHVETIWFHRDDNFKTPTMRVYVNLKPAGKVNIDVSIPVAFHKAVMEIAQQAADLHETQMRSEILGEDAATLIEPKED